MRVTFIEYKYLYKGKYPEPDGVLPLLEKIEFARHSGKVVDTIVQNAPDTLGNLIATPHFVIMLDDGTFTTASIYDCIANKDDL